MHNDVAVQQWADTLPTIEASYVLSRLANRPDDSFWYIDVARRVQLDDAMLYIGNTPTPAELAAAEREEATQRRERRAVIAARIAALRNDGRDSAADWMQRMFDDGRIG